MLAALAQVQLVLGGDAGEGAAALIARSDERAEVAPRQSANQVSTL